MVSRWPESDPTMDAAASDVLAAYVAAGDGRLATVDAYRAGIEAWRRVHPDQSAAYAAKKAVAVILAAKGSSLLRV
jgi:hypothetical protein